jgi:hypothetical protein
MMLILQAVSDYLGDQVVEGLEAQDELAVRRACRRGGAEGRNKQD